MQKVLNLLTFLPMLINGQINNVVAKETVYGIRWETGLNWEQIKEKAKQENKFIFVDAFATWCKPCKAMDKEVFNNDTVSSFFNDRFISVKVQMDKTSKDNEIIKSWYADSKKIAKQYHINSFPTYIFIAPDGKLTHISKGYQSPIKFVEQAKVATKPGQVYVDKYEEFYYLLDEYNIGQKNYNRMLFMIQTSKELRDQILFKRLHDDYISYLESARLKILYRKENIAYLGSLNWRSTSKLFRKVFYPDGKKADKTMGFKGFADNVVSRVVLREVALPFTNINPASNLLVLGLRNPDTAQADWDGLYRKVLETYPRKIADIVVLDTKIKWYEQHSNWPLLAESYLEKLEKYGFDTINEQSITSYKFVNFYCWEFFERVDGKDLIERAAQQMEKAVQARPYLQAYMDTYANLLYKADKKTKAIFWEERALSLSKEKLRADPGNKSFSKQVDFYAGVLSKMRAGLPTWPVKN